MGPCIFKPDVERIAGEFLTWVENSSQHLPAAELIVDDEEVSEAVSDEDGLKVASSLFVIIPICSFRHTSAILPAHHPSQSEYSALGKAPGSAPTPLLNTSIMKSLSVNLMLTS